MVLLAGDKLGLVLFVTSVPAIAFISIKLCFVEAPGKFVARIMYGEKTVTRPVKMLSHIHLLIVQEKYIEALCQLNNMDAGFIEVEKLKMKIRISSVQIFGSYFATISCDCVCACIIHTYNFGDQTQPEVEKNCLICQHLLTHFLPFSHKIHENF